eukprot:9324452-Pyramimonas_sp.AAC.1
MALPSLQPGLVMGLHKPDELDGRSTFSGPCDTVADVGGRRGGARTVQVGAGEELPEGPVLTSTRVTELGRRRAQLLDATVDMHDGLALPLVRCRWRRGPRAIK